ncbi:MAG: hypothetical protein KDC44_08345 [Phaeodactylibacter sp.]|nr:hypothetical protein [Phaeodactylibacter sp.]
MKRIVFSTTLLALLATASTALGQRALNERIEAQRIAFITNYLSLTPEESQDFWPLYNAYRDEQEALNDSYKPQKSWDAMTDAEVEAQIFRNFEKEEQLVALKKSYYFKMKEVIPVRKIAKLNMAERAFKQELLEEIQKRRQANHPGMNRRRN